MKYPPTPSVGSRPDAGFNPLPEVCLATYSSHCYCILSTTVPPPLYPLPSREGLRSRRDATVSSLVAPSSPQLLPQLQQRRWQRACRGGACTCYGHRRFAKGASALSLMVLMAPSSPGWMPLLQLRRWRQACWGGASTSWASTQLLGPLPLDLSDPTHAPHAPLTLRSTAVSKKGKRSPGTDRREPQHISAHVPAAEDE